MLYSGYGFMGMHIFWWFFWVIAMLIFFSWLVPVRRSTWHEYQQRESPLEVLQRRYASGEMTTPEYEERRAVLERDRVGGATTTTSDRTHPGSRPVAT